MIFSQLLRPASNGLIYPGMADPSEMTSSIGNIGFKRAKRDGRNPSTGARTSRRYWSFLHYVYAIPPLVGTAGAPIY